MAGVLYATRGGTRGELISVIDAARREELRTVQVMPGLDQPCPNCMFCIGAPVVDTTTGFVYLSGSAPRTPECLVRSPRSAGGARPRWGDHRRANRRGRGASVYVVDPEAGEVVDRIDVPGMVVWSWACDPAAGSVYLSAIGGPESGVRALDTATLQLGDPIPFAGGPALTVDPTTGAVWVAGGGAAAILQ